MRISKYGVSLIRLTEEDLELVRHWRNADEIKKYMNFQEYITPEMQKKWFDSINNPENFYYIIEYKGDKIGLINDKNINWKEKTAEGGLFIWDKRYVNSVVPIMISFLVLEIAYFLLGWNKTYIKVRKDNLRAIEYNKTLGYQVMSETVDEGFISMMLDKKNFCEKADKLRRLISPVSENEKIVLTFEKIDEKNGTRQAVENIIKLASPDADENEIEIQNYS
jgi:UDP-4-amino-4,6-dideoxy-N-acetyl-beta-L-altrosamine N-acetyltransferase